MKISKFMTLVLLLLLLACKSSAMYSVWGLRRLITEQTDEHSLQIPPVPSPDPPAKGLKTSPTDGDKPTDDKPASDDKGIKASPTDGDKSTNNNPIPNDKEPIASSTGGDKSTNNNPISSDKEPKASSTDVDKSTNDKLVPNDKEPTASRPGGDKSNKDKPKDVQVSSDPGKSNPKSSQENDNKSSVAAPPTDMPSSTEKNGLKKEKSGRNADTKSGGNESCEGLTEPCRLRKNLIACIQSLESGSKGLRLLIINEGEGTLKVNITLPTSLTNVVEELVIPGKQSEKISIPPAAEKSSKILLRAGDEECTLSVGPVTIQQNFFEQLPSYYKQVTPIYIAVSIFFVALILGGTCACCQLKRRKRQDGGVPYQELEMGIPESASATNVETADGWDDGWDDDWDEDKAVKSRAIGISANGLSARTSKQDGWGKEWDD